jgi:hypothetical protein
MDARGAFLISPNPKENLTLCECPKASTMVGYSMTLQRTVYVAVTCKQWSCSFCGRQKVVKFAKIAEAAKPNRFITLTVNNSLYETPRDAYDATRRRIPNLIRSIRRDHGSFEFMRVLEVTRKGWPHYHFIARSDYIPQGWLSNEWAALVGAPIVDVRKIKRHVDAYFYVVKYLAKQHYIPWTNRRVTFSKHYAPPIRKEDRPTLQLEQADRDSLHPNDYARWYLTGEWVERISPLVFGTTNSPKMDEAKCPLQTSTECGQDSASS